MSLLTRIKLQQLKDKCKELKIKDYGTKIKIVKRIEHQQHYLAKSMFKSQKVFGIIIVFQIKPKMGPSLTMGVKIKDALKELNFGTTLSMKRQEWYKTKS